MHGTGIRSLSAGEKAVVCTGLQSVRLPVKTPPPVSRIRGHGVCRNLFSGVQAPSRIWGCPLVIWRAIPDETGHCGRRQFILVKDFSCHFPVMLMSLPWWMVGVDPRDFLRGFDRLDGQFHHNRFPVIAYQYTDEFLFRASIQLLMRHKRGNVDEIARPRIGEILQSLSPSQARPSTNHVDHAFQLPVVMSSRPGIRWNRDRTCPNLIRTGRGIGYGRPEVHTRPRCRVVIQLVMPHDANTIVAPFRFFRLHRATPQSTS